MNILLLEDNSYRIRFFNNGLSQHKVIVCRHAKVAKKALRKEQFDIIFLDHDLGGKPEDPESVNCGTEVARFIVDRCIDYQHIILHTENDIGREAMADLLLQAHIIPYSKLKKIGLKNLLQSLESDGNHGRN